MAVFHQGPLTNGIRGKVGNLIFQMVNGIQIVRSMPASIQDHNTPLQQIQRAAFAQAVAEWRLLTVEERAQWDFQVSLRGNRQTHLAARRVDGCPKPTCGTLFDGHNSVVAQKSREADSKRLHWNTEPAPIDLQKPPPFNKTKNVPPAHAYILLAVGSLGAAWSPLPGYNLDGLWWYYNEVVERTAGSLARVLVQPPYPIHRQRITMDDEFLLEPWGEEFVPGEFDGAAWAWKAQVKNATVRIVSETPPNGDREIQIPYVWKSQLDFLDTDFLDTKGSAVIRFYLPETLPEGLWQVWPAPLTLLAPEP